MSPAGTVPWWHTAVIYEIYVRSFADGNGDGIGDLPGARQRLPYVRDLGVDAIWLTPFYPSPQRDAGYDVSDYRGVDPRFGTLDDFDALMATARDLGLRVIIDLVPNHTSSDHPWFRAALAAAPGSRERARYVFRRGRGPAGERPPNDWHSVFGGAAWSPAPDAGQWYLHLFDAAQPDLDWTNDDVRAEFESVQRFWLDRGVDGFRIDVAHGLAKDPDMPDLAGRFASGGPAPEGHPHWDQDEVHDVYRSWRRLIDTYPGDRVYVGEVWVETPRRLARYVRPDELHTAFNFNVLLAPWEAGALRAAVDESIACLGSVGAPATWVLSNHDVMRHVTRYGGGAAGARRARAAALLLLALPGGAYVYQGEELGLPEVEDLADAVRQDPTFRRTEGAQKGRDGCRVPLPWSGSDPPFGFTSAPAAWLPQPPEWANQTVDAELADPGSMLALYRRALALRHRLPGLCAAMAPGAPLDWVDSGRALVAFRRAPGFACVVNVGDQPAAIPADVAAMGTPVLTSAPVAGDVLPGATAAWWSTGPAERHDAA